jgi:hypothetical protein
VSVSHRDVPQAPDVDRAEKLAEASPPSRRLRHDRWRDPRLWFGVVLVLASVLVGASVFSAADDTVAVWAVGADLSAGMPLTRADVHPVRVHFDDAGSSAAYLSADDPLPVGAVVTRDVANGELLAAAAVGGPTAQPDQLPLAVSAAGLPAGISVGDTVDVWAVPGSAGSAPSRSATSREVLDSVVVTALAVPDAAGLDTSREVLVALPGRSDVGNVLDGLRGADVVLVRVGGR